MASQVWRSYLNSQLHAKIPIPTKSFAGQTIMVTGSNTGMGLEAARHFARLGCSKLILAVRSQFKGQAAKVSIEKSTGCGKGVVEVWELDLGSYDSVKKFGERVDTELERLDVVVENAGVLSYESSWVGEDEGTVLVNLVNTVHHALLMMRKLRETSLRYRDGEGGKLVFTGSWTHGLVDLEFMKGIGEGEVLNGVGRKVERDTPLDRYAISKLLQMLIVEHLAAEITASDKPGNIIVNTVNPGGVRTDINRGAPFGQRLMAATMSWTLRTAEVGGRTLVHGAEGGRETHGGYLDDCKVGRTYECARSPAAVEAQKRVWGELMAKLARINPATVDVI